MSCPKSVIEIHYTLDGLQEFHENLDQKMVELSKWQEANDITDDPEGRKPQRVTPGGPPAHVPKTSPPPSIFKELKPSGKRYSLLSKTEL